MKRILRGREGAAAVEFAIILPIFLLLLFGVVEFGLIMYAKGIISQASRAGARSGVVYRMPPRNHANEEQAIRQVVNGYLQIAGFTTVDPQISGAGGTTGNPLTVQVVLPYHYLMLPFGDITLSATTVMNME